MLRSIRNLLLAALVLTLTACPSARHLPQPLLDRNDRPLTPGDLTAALDLDTCRNAVQAAAPMSIQPRWIPPLGVAANGVVLGTADVAHPVWPSRDAYRQAMERCLGARGYEIRGWQ